MALGKFFRVHMGMDFSGGSWLELYDSVRKGITTCTLPLVPRVPESNRGLREYTQRRSTYKPVGWTQHQDATGRQTLPKTYTRGLTAFVCSASKLTGIHAVQGGGHPIELLEEVIIVDMLCVRPYRVLMAYYLDARIYLEHSSSSCVRLWLLGEEGGRTQLLHTGPHTGNVESP